GVCARGASDEKKEQRGKKKQEGLQFRLQSAQPYFPQSLTNRHSPSCCSSSPSAVRRTRLSTWACSSPKGMTSLPPRANCSTSGWGSPGAPAVTRIASNGACSDQPRGPSPTRNA